MRRSPLALAIVIALAGCATATAPDVFPPPEMSAPQAAAAPASTPRSRAAAPNPAAVEVYKKQAAQRIVAANSHLHADKLPEILKSVVVLDISVDRNGNPVRVSVRRSNGYKDLERAALDSVKRAGPLPAPATTLLAGGATVSYVETWLFRGDGRFQIRSIAGVQPGSPGSVAQQ
jgi:protein TonB